MQLFSVPWVTEVRTQKKSINTEEVDDLVKAAVAKQALAKASADAADAAAAGAAPSGPASTSGLTAKEDDSEKETYDGEAAADAVLDCMGRMARRKPARKSTASGSGGAGLNNSFGFQMSSVAALAHKRKCKHSR